jgi:hypothetical protein
MIKASSLAGCLDAGCPHGKPTRTARSVSERGPAAARQHDSAVGTLTAPEAALPSASMGY